VASNAFTAGTVAEPGNGSDLEEHGKAASLTRDQFLKLDFWRKNFGYIFILKRQQILILILWPIVLDFKTL
jgi:hypothetical protein